MFDPAPYQPLSVFFDLKIGGLEKIYHYPNVPLEFELRHQKGISYVTFTLFDEAGWEVEPYIWDSRDRDGENLAQGTFKFGYTQPEGIESEEYNFLIQNYRPRFKDNAFYLTIYGMITSMSLMTSTNQYSGTVEDIIKDIADDHGLDYKIEPPFGKNYMKDAGVLDRNTTEKRERKFNKFVWENDWRFLNRILYYAVDQEGKVGYSAIVTDVDGTKTLLITRPKNSSADYEYKVQHRSSIVTDWAPDVNFAGVFNATDTQFNYHQLSTGYPSKIAAAHETTKDKFEDFGQKEFQTIRAMPKKDPPDKIHHKCPETMPESVTKGAVRIRNTSGRTPWAGSIPALYSQISQWMAMNTATLEVAGDPRIKVVSQNNGIALVDVDFRTPINYFNTNERIDHYTGGIWMVQEVVHTISVGQFLTTYSLIRPGHDKKPERGEKSSGG